MKIKWIYKAIKYSFLPISILLLIVAYSLLNTLIFIALPVFIIAIILVVSGAICFVNTVLTKNKSYINKQLDMNIRTIAKNKIHNAFTDMVYFKGEYYIAYAVSPMHLGNEKCNIIIKKSKDLLDWEEVTKFNSIGEDIRDPKMGVIKDKLVLFVLLNIDTQPQPYKTNLAYSEDGYNWSKLHNIEKCDGWLFWRPKSYDGETWFCPAYWYKFNKVAMFKSTDGIQWEYHSLIYEGGIINESCFEFTDAGEMIVAGRMEYSKEAKNLAFGHEKGSTLILKSDYPYDDFNILNESLITRLDGPVLFKSRGKIYAMGRRQPYINNSFSKQGSIFAKKRTALYRIDDDGLKFISDLPSAGDTSYGGAVVEEGKVYLSYYTNDTKKDSFWIFGMIEPTIVNIAVLEEDKLHNVVAN